MIRLNEIQQQQQGILPFIQELVLQHENATYEVTERDIQVDIPTLPYGFSYAFFERFGWQAFLVPKSKLIEENFSNELYVKLQDIATNYNQTMRFEESPELHLFS